VRGAAEGRVGCIYLDIDHFKQYNDKNGHAEGDAVLVKMARFLMRHVRAEEAVVRVGGDEFLVVLCDSDEDQTEHVVARLSAAAPTSAPVPFSMGGPREEMARRSKTLWFAQTTSCWR